MNSIFIHFNVTAALFFFRDSNKGLFVDNCFMMIGKQIPCSLLALRRVAHENCGCSRTTAIFFIAEKRIDRSSTPFRLSCWRRYGTRFEFVDNADNTIQDPFSWLQNSRRMRKPNCFLCARIMRYGALSIAHLTGSGPSNCSAQMPPPCHVQIVCPPMNYDKATIFYVLVPYIRRVGNRPEKLAISTLLELW